MRAEEGEAGNEASKEGKSNNSTGVSKFIFAGAENAALQQFLVLRSSDSSQLPPTAALSGAAKTGNFHWSCF